MSNKGKFSREFEKETGYKFHPWRWLFGAVGIFLAIYLVLVACTAVTMPFSSALGIGKRVTNPDRVIFTYEHFHDLCAGIFSKDQQYGTAIAAAREFDKRTKDKPDPLGRNADESARLHQDADGIKYARQQDAQQYNADSRKWTQNLFKSRGLPYRIDDTTPMCDGQIPTP
jgi:hypothetical protein